jgi:hypothetical protein
MRVISSCFHIWPGLTLYFPQHIMHISRYIFVFLFSELPIHLLWLNELEGLLYTMAKDRFHEVVRTLQNLFEGRTVHPLDFLLSQAFTRLRSEPNSISLPYQIGSVFFSLEWVLVHNKYMIINQGLSDFDVLRSSSFRFGPISLTLL